MNVIYIKPHHLFDIIKLYGNGIEKFTEDKAYKHDFYVVANKIIDNNKQKLKLVLGEDDICKPCIYINKGVCTDTINHIKNITSKDEFNKLLDKRFLEKMNLSLDEIYEVKDILEIYCKNEDKILEIWREERGKALDKRYILFLLGIEKLRARNYF